MGYTTYLRLAGVTGECTEEAHRGWLSVESFNHTICASQPQGTAPTIADLTIAKYVDRTTPLLARATVEDRLFPEALIELCRTDGAKARFMEIRLTKVRVTMHTLSGGPQADVQTPYENVSLGFEKIEWNYFPAAFEAKRDAAAEVRAGWNSPSALATA